MSHPTPEYQFVIQTIHKWPEQQKLALIQELINASNPSKFNSEKTKQPTLSRALGLLAKKHSTPSDQQITDTQFHAPQDKDSQQECTETIDLPQIEDPLLALAGVLQSPITDISENHDDHIGQAIRVDS